MTEAEWLAAADPVPMLAFLRGRAGDRKLILFCAACIRRYNLDQARFPDALVQTLEADEAYADRRIGVGDLRAAYGVAWRDRPTPPENPWNWAASWTGSGTRLAPRRAPAAERSAILRCVFGNPFRPVAPDPAWLTSPVLALARQMYETRDFSPMPLLADALQEAGCDNPDVLAHCRGDGPHVRGCWVIDLLTGRT